VGISTDHHLALAAWQKDQGSKQLFLSDFRRQMLPAYGAMQTDEKSPVFRYAKRAYFIIDKTGTVKFMKKVHEDHGQPPRPARGGRGPEGHQGRLLIRR